MEIAVKERSLRIGDKTFEMPYSILDARQIDDRVVVIFYDMDFPRWRQPQNLMAFDLSGRELWTAEHPTNQTNDCYVNFIEDKPLTVGNFAGYVCIIDVATGKLLDSNFTK